MPFVPLLSWTVFTPVPGLRLSSLTVAARACRRRRRQTRSHPSRASLRARADTPKRHGAIVSESALNRHRQPSSRRYSAASSLRNAMNACNSSSGIAFASYGTITAVKVSTNLAAGSRTDSIT